MLQIIVKGLTTPLLRWVRVGVCLCRYSVTCALSPTGLIPWFSKTEGNTYATLLHHPILFGEIQRSAQEVAIVITMRFSINCSAVICSPTVIISILREASSETYGPRVYFSSYKFPIYNFSFLFTSFAIFYFPFHKPKILKNYFTVYPSPSDLTLQITLKGLITPLSRWVQVGVCLCRYSVTCALSPTGLIPWFSKLREILTLLCCITLSSSREKPTQAQEVARRPTPLTFLVKYPSSYTSSA